MRTHEILKLGISISISFYSASSVDVSIGRRRNRRAIHHSRGISESTTESNRGYKHATRRSLGVGLENLKYGKSVKQHYVVEERGGGKGKQALAPVPLSLRRLVRPRARAQLSGGLAPVRS